MSDEQAAAEQTEAQEAPQDGEEAQTGAPVELSEEDVAKIEAEIERQADKFKRLWLRFDSNFDNESLTTVTQLKKTMKKINDLTEQLTGQPGTLSFAELLDRIDASGEGASSEEIEEMNLLLEQYAAANEALKEAEAMLTSEVKRLRYLLKTHQYDKVEIDNPSAIVQNLLSKKEAFEDLVKDIESFAGLDEDKVQAAYTRQVDTLLKNRYDTRAYVNRGLKETFLRWAVRSLDMPGSYEDLLELQCIIPAQKRTMEAESRLVTRLAEFEESLQGFSQALECIAHNAYMTDEMREALGEFEALELRLQEMDRIKTERDAERDRAERISDELDTVRSELQEQKNISRVMEDRVDSLREALRRQTGFLTDDEIEDLKTEDPEKLREACSAFASRAMRESSEDATKDQLYREISALKLQIQHLHSKPGSKKVRKLSTGKNGDDDTLLPETSLELELVDRDSLERLLESNRKLQDALDDFRSRYEQLEEDLITAKKDADKLLEDTKAKHQEALEKKSATIAEKDEEILRLRKENKELQEERGTFRRTVSIDSESKIRKYSVLGIMFGAAATYGGIELDQYMDEQRAAAQNNGAIEQPLEQGTLDGRDQPRFPYGERPVTLP